MHITRNTRATELLRYKPQTGKGQLYEIRVGCKVWPGVTSRLTHLMHSIDRGEYLDTHISTVQKTPIGWSLEDS